MDAKKKLYRLLIFGGVMILLQACLSSTPVPTVVSYAENTHTSVPSRTPERTATLTLEAVTYTANNNLNCRQGPGTIFPIVVVIMVGDEVDIIGKSPSDWGEWWQVSVDPDVCWVSADLGTINGDASLVEVVEIPPTPVGASSFPTDPPAGCDASSSVQIDNNTGASVTLSMSGPANYTFYLNTGSNTLWVCPGSYSYSAYGCGGAYDNGNITSGDSIEFYCQ